MRVSWRAANKLLSNINTSTRKNGKCLTEGSSTGLAGRRWIGCRESNFYQGIDLVRRGRIKNRSKKDSKSKNLYHHLLVKLFRFLSRRTDSGFSKTVLRRLVSSRVNRPPVSLSKLIKHLNNK